MQDIKIMGLHEMPQFASGGRQGYGGATAVKSHSNIARQAMYIRQILPLGFAHQVMNFVPLAAQPFAYMYNVLWHTLSSVERGVQHQPDLQLRGGGHAVSAPRGTNPRTA